MPVPPCRLAFLLDVDNTLIDNDRLRGGLTVRLGAVIGAAATERFWLIYEQVRAELDHVHFAEILLRLRAAIPGVDRDGDLERALATFPFADYCFGDSLATIAHLRTLGRVVITSDGDDLYQVAKVRGSGLGAAVERVWIVPHKQAIYGEVAVALAAERWVVVDDKPAILAAARQHWGDACLTVWMRHGKYAQDAAGVTPDLAIDEIGELLAVPPARWCR